MATESTNVKFSCPHCGQHLAVESDMAGLESDCPNCGKKVIVNTSNAEENGVAIDINSNINTLKSEEVAQDSATSSDNNTVTNDNPFLKDWENAKAKAKAGGEVAKEYGKKAARTLGEAGDALKAKWEEESAKNRKSNATHGEWLALKFKAIKDTLKWSTNMLYAKFPFLKKICNGVKSFVLTVKDCWVTRKIIVPTFLFCLSSMWFVLRSIVLGICWIFNIVKSGVSFVYLKLKQTSFVEKHIEIIEKLGVIVKVIMHFVYAIFYPFKWFWSHVIIPINNCWKRYEIRRAGFGDRCPLLTDNFSLSIGRRLASGIVGLVIFALIGVLSIVDFEEIREERERTRRYEQHIAWRNSLAHSENPTLEEKKAMGSFYFYFISFKVNKAKTFKAASASLVDGADARGLVNASINYLEAVIEDKYERDCPEDFIVTGKIFLEECAKELLVRVKNTYGETIIKETFESNEKVKQNANLKQKCEMAYRSIRFQTVNWDLDRAKYDFESVIERYGGNEVLTKWFTSKWFTSESNNEESSILEAPKGVCPF